MDTGPHMTQITLIVLKWVKDLIHTAKTTLFLMNAYWATYNLNLNRFGLNGELLILIPSTKMNGTSMEYAILSSIRRDMEINIMMISCSIAILLDRLLKLWSTTKFPNLSSRIKNSWLRSWKYNQSIISIQIAEADLFLRFVSVTIWEFQGRKNR